MKIKILTLTTVFFLCFSFFISAKDKSKEKEEITFLVSMTCEKCQQRIEDNISFEKGVTDLIVNLPQKTVTIEYRKDKTSPEKLKAAICKLGYTATPLKSTKEK